MKGKIFVLALFSLLSTACTCQKKSSEMKMPETSSNTVNATYPNQKPGMDISRLVEKQNIFLKDYKMNMKFIKVTKDNRCPINTTCITEGFALVEIEVMGTYTRPRTFILSTVKGENYFVFSGKKVTLEKLYPSLSKEMGLKELQGKYVVDLRVEPTIR